MLHAIGRGFASGNKELFQIALKHGAEQTTQMSAGKLQVTRAGLSTSSNNLANTPPSHDSLKSESQNCAIKNPGATKGNKPQNNEGLIVNSAETGGPIHEQNTTKTVEDSGIGMCNMKEINSSPKKIAASIIEQMLPNTAISTATPTISSDSGQKTSIFNAPQCQPHKASDEGGPVSSDETLISSIFSNLSSYNRSTLKAPYCPPHKAFDNVDSPSLAVSSSTTAGSVFARGSNYNTSTLKTPHCPPHKAFDNVDSPSLTVSSSSTSSSVFASGSNYNTSTLKTPHCPPHKAFDNVDSPSLTVSSSSTSSSVFASGSNYNTSTLKTPHCPPHKAFDNVDSPSLTVSSSSTSSSVFASGSNYNTSTLKTPHCPPHKAFDNVDSPSLTVSSSSTSSSVFASGSNYNTSTLKTPHCPPHKAFDNVDSPSMTVSSSTTASSVFASESNYNTSTLKAPYYPPHKACEAESLSTDDSTFARSSIFASVSKYKICGLKAHNFDEKSVGTASSSSASSIPATSPTSSVPGISIYMSGNLKTPYCPPHKVDDASPFSYSYGTPFAVTSNLEQPYCPPHKTDDIKGIMPLNIFATSPGITSEKSSENLSVLSAQMNSEFPLNAAQNAIFSQSNTKSEIQSASFPKLNLPRGETEESKSYPKDAYYRMIRFKRYRERKPNTYSKCPTTNPFRIASSNITGAISRISTKPVKTFIPSSNVGDTTIKASLAEDTSTVSVSNVAANTSEPSVSSEVSTQALSRKDVYVKLTSSITSLLKDKDKKEFRNQISELITSLSKGKRSKDVFSKKSSDKSLETTEDPPVKYSAAPHSPQADQGSADVHNTPKTDPSEKTCPARFPGSHPTKLSGNSASTKLFCPNTGKESTIRCYPRIDANITSTRKHLVNPQKMHVKFSTATNFLSKDFGSHMSSRSSNAISCASKGSGSKSSDSSSQCDSSSKNKGKDKEKCQVEKPATDKKASSCDASKDKKDVNMKEKLSDFGKGSTIVASSQAKGTKCAPSSAAKDKKSCDLSKSKKDDGLCAKPTPVPVQEKPAEKAKPLEKPPAPGSAPSCPQASSSKPEVKPCATGGGGKDDKGVTRILERDDQDKFKLPKRFQGININIGFEFSALAKENSALLVGQDFPDTEPPSEIVECLEQVASSNEPRLHHYGRGFGHPRLVNAVACLYSQLIQHEINPYTEVVVTVGGTHGFYCTVLSHINHGDEVIVLEPFCDHYEAIIKAAGGKLVPVPMKFRKKSCGPINVCSDWTLEIELLKCSFNNCTKMIILNNPMVPIGKSFCREDLELISALCKQWNVLCVSDETFENLVYEPNEHIRMASMPGMWERTLTICSFGNIVNVTGWRVGWVYGPQNMLNNLFVPQILTVRACPTPIQEAVAVALENEAQRFGKPDCVLDNLRSEMECKRNFMTEILCEVGLRPTLPDGTYYLIADFSVYQNDLYKNLSLLTDKFMDMRFAKWMIKCRKVQALPLSIMYAEKHRGLLDNHIRFCFCKSDDTLEKFADQLKDLRSFLVSAPPPAEAKKKAKACGRK